jgi:hypothetical protein
MVSQTRDTSEARCPNVEDELGLIGADLGQGDDVPGGLIQARLEPPWRGIAS